MTPDAPTNTEGPAGTYGCACVHHDRWMCYELRYGHRARELNEHCECLCHEWDDEEDDTP